MMVEILERIYCNIDEDENNVKTLDDIFMFLDEGIEKEDKFTPEMKVEFHEGDFNIEYVIIYSESGKELYRDSDYITT